MSVLMLGQGEVEKIIFWCNSTYIVLELENLEEKKSSVHRL